MAKCQWVIFWRRRDVAVARKDRAGIQFLKALPLADEVEQLAAAVSMQMRENGYRGEPVVLALDSHRTLAATIPYDRMSMRRDGRIMGFALEEFLPLAAEEVVSDFIVFPSQALGVSLPIDASQPLVSQLEKHGVTVQSIVPAALLALQGNGAFGSGLLCWKHDEGIELFRLQDGKPQAWRQVTNISSLMRELSLLVDPAETAMPLMARGFAAGERDVVGNGSSGWLQAVQCQDGSFQEDAVRGASAVLQSQRSPLIELRRGPLIAADPMRFVRGRLRLVIAMSILSFACLIAACEILSARYGQIKRERIEAEEELFRRTFPGHKVPVGIRTRFETELAQRIGAAGQHGQYPQLRSALATLHLALASLPTDLRFRLLEIRIDQTSVHLEGEARRHGDAELIADGLKKGGLSVKPPSTQTLPTDGVSMTILGELKSEKESAP
jgi:hypothetical protein